MPEADSSIRILHLEDSSRDAGLIADLFAEQELRCAITRVSERATFERALREPGWDVILTDFNLPGYDGISALRAARETQPRVPVIVLSGSLGEEEAIGCVQLGATDYVLKQRLNRLLPAVQRALQEAAEQRRRHEAEIALEESERRFRLLVDAIEEVFWLADPALSRIDYISPACERIWGRTVDEIKSAPATLSAIIHPEDRRRVALARAVQQQGRAFDQEYRIVRPGGETRWIWDRGFPVRDGTGRVSHHASVTSDVTARKRFEEAQRSVEQRFAAIFHRSPVAIGYLDPQGTILDANEAACTFSGYSRDELIGRTFDELRLWARPEVGAAAMARLQGAKVIGNEEVEIRRKSGELRTALFSMEVLETFGEPAVLISAVDITDRKALQEQLQRMQRVQSVGMLASGVAHDMNNILAPIMMAVPLLRTPMTAPAREKMLGTVEACAQRGAALVRQLVIFGRGAEGDRRPVRTADIAREVAQISSQTFPRNIDVRHSIEPDIWPVHGDASQLHQVLLNLCVNARDAMPEGGTLSITAENREIDAHYAAFHPDSKPGRYVVIHVTDTGQGIDPAVIDRIFDPFFTTKEIGKGTGLGLSTVLGIVKGHGGVVRVRSQPGKGTTFEIDLPASPTSVQAVGKNQDEPAITGRGELVLIVDDETPVRSLLRETLVRNNYKALTAEDGVDAIAQYAPQVREISLVITDLDMPVMNGVALTRVLRQMNPEVKIVISTGYNGGSSSEQRAAELEKLNVNALLMKPYTARDLITLVRDVLDGVSATG